MSVLGGLTFNIWDQDMHILDEKYRCEGVLSFSNLKEYSVVHPGKH